MFSVNTDGGTLKETERMAPIKQWVFTPKSAVFCRRTLHVAGSPQLTRLLLLALPVMAAFGSLIRVAGPMFGFRVLLVVTLAIVFLKYRSFPWTSASARAFLRMMFVWLLLGYSSIFWAIDKMASVTQLFGVTLGLALGVGLVMLAHSTKSETAADTLVRGWTIAFAITGVIAIYEKFSGHHLSNYLVDAAVPALTSQQYIASVFGNPNAYAAFLITALPFELWGLMRAQTRSSRLMFFASLVALIALLLLTGSRICMLAAFAQVAVAVIVLASRRFRLVVLAGVATLAIASITGAIASLASLFPFLPQKLFANTGMESLLLEVSSSSTSGGERINLLKDGFWMIYKTHGIGVGAGNFQANVLMAPYPTHRIVDPHNLWMEILAEYGLVVFFLIAAWLAMCLMVGFRLIKHERTSHAFSGRPLGLAIITSILGNLIASVANSTYLTSSTNWLFLACLGVMAIIGERALPRRSTTDRRDSQGRERGDPEIRRKGRRVFFRRHKDSDPSRAPLETRQSTPHEVSGIAPGPARRGRLYVRPAPSTIGTCG